MSEYIFKNLSEIDTVESPADGTTMMGFQNGVPIQMPMSAVKSCFRMLNTLKPLLMD